MSVAKVIMTKELADKLIAWYEESISIISEKDIHSIRYILYERYIDSGICNCAQSKYRIRVYDCKWVNSFGNSAYWYGVPSCLSSKKDIIESLQNRINRLKTF